MLGSLPTPGGVGCILSPLRGCRPDSLRRSGGL